MLADDTLTVELRLTRAAGGGWVQVYGDRYLDGPPRTVLAHGNMWAAPQTSWREEWLKLIVTPAQSRVELYDWRADRGERSDLAQERPEEVTRLSRDLELVESHMSSLRRGSAAELSAEEASVLEGLGYATGDAEED